MDTFFVLCSICAFSIGRSQFNDTEWIPITTDDSPHTKSIADSIASGDPKIITILACIMSIICCILCFMCYWMKSSHYHKEYLPQKASIIASNSATQTPDEHTLDLHHKHNDLIQKPSLEDIKETEKEEDDSNDNIITDDNIISNDNNMTRNDIKINDIKINDIKIDDIKIDIDTPTNNKILDMKRSSTLSVKTPTLSIPQGSHRHNKHKSRNSDLSRISDTDSTSNENPIDTSTTNTHQLMDVYQGDVTYTKTPTCTISTDPFHHNIPSIPTSPYSIVNTNILKNQDRNYSSNHQPQNH